MRMGVQQRLLAARRFSIVRVWILLRLRAAERSGREDSGAGFGGLTTCHDASLLLAKGWPAMLIPVAVEPDFSQ